MQEFTIIFSMPGHTEVLVYHQEAPGNFCRVLWFTVRYLYDLMELPYANWEEQEVFGFEEAQPSFNNG